MQRAQVAEGASLVLPETLAASRESAQNHQVAAADDFRQRFLVALDRPFPGEELFDGITDTVFFLKDHAGRYVAVNRTLVARCGVAGKSDLIGRTALEVFPAPLGAHIAEQDAGVVADRRSIAGQLERHLYPGGSEGWCLTWKEPLIGHKGRAIGLAGIFARSLSTAGGDRRHCCSRTRTRSHSRQPRAAAALARAGGAGGAYRLPARPPDRRTNPSRSRNRDRHLRKCSQ